MKDKKPTLSLAFLSRVPVDDVWIRAHYPRPQFSLEESLMRHKEFADPSMLDNMEGLVYADMELNMKTAKKVKAFFVPLTFSLWCVLSTPSCHWPVLQDIFACQIHHLIYLCYRVYNYYATSSVVSFC